VIPFVAHSAAPVQALHHSMLRSDSVVEPASAWFATIVFCIFLMRLLSHQLISQ